MNADNDWYHVQTEAAITLGLCLAFFVGFIFGTATYIATKVFWLSAVVFVLGIAASIYVCFRSKYD